MRECTLVAFGFAQLRVKPKPLPVILFVILFGPPLSYAQIYSIKMQRATFYKTKRFTLEPTESFQLVAR